MQQRFPFDEEKAAQAAAFLLNRHGGRLNYMLLIKLLYYADRAALVNTGRPITGDTMVSMDYGPVLSNALNLVRSSRDTERDWHKYVSPREPNYTVSARTTNVETTKLSEFELRILVNIDSEHGDKDPFDLSAESHNLPEWHDPSGSSSPIDLEEILSSAGMSDEDLSFVSATARAERFFRRLQEQN